MNRIVFDCEDSVKVSKITTALLLCFLSSIAVIGSTLCFETMNEALFIGVGLTIVFALSFKPFNDDILVWLLLYFDFRGHNLNLIYNLILCSYFNIMFRESYGLTPQS